MVHNGNGSSDQTAPTLHVLGVISAAHLVNDLAQSLLVASYPVLRGGFHLDFTDLGTLTLGFQLTSSLLQPLIGSATDRRPRRWALAAGSGMTALGLVTLAWAGSYAVLLAASLMLGVGSSVFHPEAARVARFAANGRHGFAQSIFQVGGNAGGALGPLLVALFVLPLGQGAIAFLALLPLAAMPVLGVIGRWSQEQRPWRRSEDPGQTATLTSGPRGVFALLFVLILAKFFYLASFSNYFVFYMASRFGTAEGTAQIALVGILFVSAASGLLGGRLSDRVGARTVIGLSFWGALPFSLILPHVGPALTVVMATSAAAVIASAFSAIVVYAQALMPHRVGLVSGLFFGAAFGMAGLAAAALGVLADHAGIARVYEFCAFLPLAGLLVPLLPRHDHGSAEEVPSIGLGAIAHSIDRRYPNQPMADRSTGACDRVGK